MPQKLILASTSPYRKELLSRLGLPFEVANPQTDETPLPDESPEAMALDRMTSIWGQSWGVAILMIYYT